MGANATRCRKKGQDAGFEIDPRRTVIPHATEVQVPQHRLKKRWITGWHLCAPSPRERLESSSHRPRAWTTTLTSPVRCSLWARGCPCQCSARPKVVLKRVPGSEPVLDSKRTSFCLTLLQTCRPYASRWRRLAWVSVPELGEMHHPIFFLHASRQVGCSPDHFHRIGLPDEESHYDRGWTVGCRLAKGPRIHHLGPSNHVEIRDE